MQLLQYEKNALLLKSKQHNMFPINNLVDPSNNINNTSKNTNQLRNNNSIVYSQSKTNKQLNNKSDYFSTKQSVTTQRNHVISSSSNSQYQFNTPQYTDKNNNKKYLPNKQ